MPLVTAAKMRTQRLCACPARGRQHCRCARRYSQPDCDIGWDSYRNMYFFGYHVYTLVAAESPYDLPLYPRLQRATRHDAISWVVSATSYRSLAPTIYRPSILTDAAAFAGFHKERTADRLSSVAEGLDPFPKHNRTPHLGQTGRRNVRALTRGDMGW